MYDPTLGRWLEQDPIGFDAGDMNLYRFVGNDPTNSVDPSGLEAISIGGGTLTSTTDGDESSFAGVGISFTFPRPLKEDYLLVKQWMQIEVYAYYACPGKDSEGGACTNLEEKFLPSRIQLKLPEGAEDDHGHSHETATRFPPIPQPDNGKHPKKGGFSEGPYSPSNGGKTITYTDNPTIAAALYGDAVKQVLAKWGRKTIIRGQTCTLDSVKVVQRFVTVVYLNGNPVRTIEWTSTATSNDPAKLTTGIIGSYAGERGPSSVMRPGGPPPLPAGPDW